MKRLVAIIFIIVVLLILGATPVFANGPLENGNFGGNEGQGWYYAGSNWYRQCGHTNHRINWVSFTFVIPSDEPGYNANYHAPIGTFSGADTSQLDPPMD